MEQPSSTPKQGVLMPVTVRDATEADLSGILAIYNEAIRTSAAVYTEQEATLEDRKAWFAQRTSQGYPVLVAEDPTDNTVLGFATFGDFRPWPGYRHTIEHPVYIRTDARGQGLGKLLIEPLFGRAAALGKHVMVAGIDAANPASIRLHERLGFERVGTLREVGTKFGRWLDLVFMQRVLDGVPEAGR
jgi:phosphinothricin acetyltransferase